MSDVAWLLPDLALQEEQSPLRLGTLIVTHGSSWLFYRDPQQRDLLTTFSRFMVTLEPAGTVPLTPALDPQAVVCAGGIPNVPTPSDPHHYSALDHVRHLLAADPTLEALHLYGGLDIHLYRNAVKILEWAIAARDEWAGGQATAELHRQVIRILDDLDGASVTVDVPPGTPFLADPHSGRIGLLEVSPDQPIPGYLTHVNLHLIGLSQSPGVTGYQRQRAMRIAAAINAIAGLLQQIRRDTTVLVQMSTAQLQKDAALALLDDLVKEANLAYVGKVDPTTSATTDGLVWVHNQIQQLATMAVTSP
jgi:hypothetical protein